MFWIVITFVTIISILFILSFIGVTYNKKTGLTTLSSLKTGSFTTKCSQEKVNCVNDDDCKKKCLEAGNQEYKCQPIVSNKAIPSIFSLLKDSIKFTFDDTNNKFANNINTITTPLKDKNSKDILFYELQKTTVIYINFKPSDSLNYDYNFIPYSILNSQITESNIIVNVKIKSNPNNITNINFNNETNIDIKWVNIEVQSTEKVCVQDTDKGLPPCNIDYGGMYTWSGWTQPTGDMKWDCICNYPAFASGPECTINSYICAGGTFDWKPNQLPTEAKCTCNPGLTEVKDYRGVSYCVPSDQINWYTNYFKTNGDIIN